MIKKVEVHDKLGYALRLSSIKSDRVVLMEWHRMLEESKQVWPVVK